SAARPETAHVRARVVRALEEPQGADIRADVTAELDAELDRAPVSRIVDRRRRRRVPQARTWTGAVADRDGDARAGCFDVAAVVNRPAADRRDTWRSHDPRIGPGRSALCRMPCRAAVCRDFNGDDRAVAGVRSGA